MGRGASLWPIVGLVVLAGISGAVGGSDSSLNAFDPFCGISNRYTTTAIIKFEGKTYTSTVTRRTRYVRGWIRNLNSAGCKESLGTQHVFRTSTNRVILLPSAVCADALVALRNTGQADARALCRPEHRYWETSGTIIDDADKPRYWQPFWLKGRELPNEGGFDGVHLVKWAAEKTTAKPADDHDELVPAIVSADYRSKPVTEADKKVRSSADRFKTHNWPKGRISRTRGERDRSLRRKLRYDEFLKISPQRGL